jgi:U32 family peptidase
MLLMDIGEQTPAAVVADARKASLVPELLAPAGDWECVRAAVENGADAVYFGLDKFNARMRAHNFTEADLPRLLEFLHRRGVKGYITFNTLVFQNELEQAEEYLRTIINAGVDAAIVQDVGICRLIRQISPDFPIHVSTQMTVTSARGVEFARELGCNLVVLARECTLPEIEMILGNSPGNKANRGTLPLEVFVHGALCVAYSGQCLTSESLGGRSANRGECAQACRMPYELLADGKKVDLGDRKYLLSPQDLAGLPVLPALVRMGVASLKIEGRLKLPGYVANITRVYRRALDEITSMESGGMESRPFQVPDSDQYDMEMAFSRGLYTGWFEGVNNQELVHGRFGTKRGVLLGEILEVRRDRVAISPVGPLRPGDGVVFDAGHPEEEEEGGRVYEIFPDQPSGPQTSGSRKVWLTFGYGDVDFTRIQRGNKVWKTSDPELERRLRQSYEGEFPRFQRPIKMEVHGIAGAPLRLVVRDEMGNSIHLNSQMPLAKADKQPLITEKLREQLGRLGGSIFHLGELRNLLEGEVMIPVRELNRLRREAVSKLELARSRPRRWTMRDEPGVVRVQAGETRREPRIGKSADAELIVLCRNLAQLETALTCGVSRLYCEFEDPKKYRQAVAMVRARRAAAALPEIFVAPPRIFKMGEEWILEQVRSCNADGYLVRNYDHLRFFAHDRRVGDYSLNIANRITADYFKNRFGLERVTVSYDLNVSQLEALLIATPADWFEVTIHQHMPMFHMEHCVFCAFLTSGTDYRNCGRPCDHRDLKLRDRVGADHPVKADVGCRNTVFNSQAQTGAEFVSGMLSLGVRHFRIEFLNEEPEQVIQTVENYRQLLRGEITGQQLWRDLRLFNQLGVTRGQMAGKG